jgi:hypothetical protein
MCNQAQYIFPSDQLLIHLCSTKVRATKYNIEEDKITTIGDTSRSLGAAATIAMILNQETMDLKIGNLGKVVMQPVDGHHSVNASTVIVQTTGQPIVQTKTDNKTLKDQIVKDQEGGDLNLDQGRHRSLHLEVILQDLHQLNHNIFTD